jgi:hypothetical protein
MTTDMVVPFRIGMLPPPEKVAGETVFVTARLAKGTTFSQVQHRLDAIWRPLLAETIPPPDSTNGPTRSGRRLVCILPAAVMGDGLARATFAPFASHLVSLALCSNLADYAIARIGPTEGIHSADWLGASGNLVRQARRSAGSVFGGGSCLAFKLADPGMFTGTTTAGGPGGPLRSES